MKRIALMILMLIIVLVFSACHRPKNMGFNIKGINLSIYQGDSSLGGGDRFFGDTLNININHNIENLPYVAGFVMPGLIPSAYAFKFNDYYKISDSILQVNISSDSVFQGLSAGTSLNSFFSAYTSWGHKLVEKNMYVSLDIFKRYLNEEVLDSSPDLYARLRCTQKPLIAKPVRFFVEYTFASGRKVADTTASIIW